MLESPNLKVPILVETPGRSYFPMVRCHYLAIEYDTPSALWTIGVNGVTMPFLMIGLTGIVHQPLGAEHFNSYRLIDSFYQRIEETAGLSINFEDIWLPAFLFARTQLVGDVYRVGMELFILALAYRDTRSTQQEFEAQCKHLAEDIVYSEDETRAFGGWSSEQISIVQNREPKDRRLQLKSKEQQ
jgi:hypothetical protein